MSKELVQKIEALKTDERNLRDEIEKHLANNPKVVAGFDPSSLSLQHQIYERPVGWIYLHDCGRVVVQSGKGYYNSLDDVSMDDIETILNHVG